MPKVFKGIQRIRVKNLCLQGDDKKRLLANYPNTPRDIKVCISQLIIIRILKFSDSLYLHYMGWVKPKNHLTTVPLKVVGNEKVGGSQRWHMIDIGLGPW